ncbi:MAG: DNA adenine methylase [Actinobacteria bacterium]|nr:DNA adenine methylase [Actinomycetota bacterium]
MRLPHPIPYQGSKRNLAPFILDHFPSGIKTLIEPFAGSAAITIAAAAYSKCNSFFINDINRPLMMLFDEIINHPERIAANYEKLWNEQLGQERDFYKLVRDKFNATQRADYFLYLLARCVKASIRYNSNGEFNQSPDNRRKGRNPINMRQNILNVSRLLKSRIKINSLDYQEVLRQSTKHDLVYMDPPYQGTCGNRDSRYYAGIDFPEFVSALRDLVEREISFIISYDGRTGDKMHGELLPEALNLHRIEVNVGRSSQATLLGRDHVSYESLYLSPALLKSLDSSIRKSATLSIALNNHQLSII